MEGGWQPNRMQIKNDQSHIAGIWELYGSPWWCTWGTYGCHMTGIWSASKKRSEAHRKYMGGVWQVHGMCIGGTWEVCGSMLGATWEYIWRCARRIMEVYRYMGELHGRHITGMWKVYDQHANSIETKSLTFMPATC